MKFIYVIREHGNAPILRFEHVRPYHGTYVVLIKRASAKLLKYFNGISIARTRV